MRFHAVGDEVFSRPGNPRESNPPGEMWSVVTLSPRIAIPWRVNVRESRRGLRHVIEKGRQLDVGRFRVPW